MSWKKCARIASGLVVVAGLSAGPAWTAGSDDVAGEARAEALRSAVVKISATLRAGDAPQIGFGFIVGRQDDQVVIVTANHIVRGDEPDVEDRMPRVVFFDNQGSEVAGTLQTVSLPRDHGDLAVILAKPPPSLKIITEALSPVPAARGQPVWLIGRGGAWNVPVVPGIISQVDAFDGHIEVEGLGARVGSSGGPLIAKDGIIGMIVADSDLATKAIPIGPIERMVGGEWRYAWQLGLSRHDPVNVPGPYAGQAKPDRSAAHPNNPASPGPPAGDPTATAHTTAAPQRVVTSTGATAARCSSIRERASMEAPSDADRAFLLANCN